MKSQTLAVRRKKISYPWPSLNTIGLTTVRNLIRNYGMVFVLIGLCLLFSLLTLKEQVPESSRAVAQLVKQISESFRKDDLVLTVGAFNKDSAPFAKQLQQELGEQGFHHTRLVVGIPRDLRLELDE